MSSLNPTTTIILLAVLLLVLPTGTYAFGAGDIPDFAYLNDKAFRHGDIENVLSELVKSYGHASSGGILGLASSLISAASGGSKFTKDDVKKVYFGNWLRDYSQAMDIAGLTKLSGDTIVLIISVLGFLTFGFATDEFEVTAERLGVYLPVEHIDNPKGYAEKEGDARQFHPKLRPPVRAEELQIDQRTGMKNYMATENRGWDTSTALIRRVFRACIEHGRRSGGREGAELWEAYRLLGTGLHTMEDLLAHSNWCEIALRKMGHSEVFCHVGDRVIINTPNGPAPPLITGTFGSADFIHSLMGEATDHLSQASVVDLSAKMSAASSGDGNALIDLKHLLSKIPLGSGGDSDLDKMNQMHEESKAYRFNPNDIASPQLQKKLFQLLVTRDNIYRTVLKAIEQIPGLSDLLEALTNALNAYIYTILAPYLTPLLQQVSSVLAEGSQAVIDSDDQYEVFNNPNASDPSHSLLSKDHFALILNEPAGKIALVVVRHTVDLIVRAWSEDVNPDQVIDQVLEAFHHPYYATGRSRIQNDMFQEMQRWVDGLEDRRTTLSQLTKESVRASKNKRQGSDNDMTQSDKVYGGNLPTGNYGNAPRPTYGSSQSSGGYGGGYTAGASYGGHGKHDTSGDGYIAGGYGSSEQGYGRTQNESSYGGQYGSSGGGYGQSQSHGSSQTHYGAAHASGGYRPPEGPPAGRYGTTYSSQTSHGQAEQSPGRQYPGYDNNRSDNYSDHLYGEQPRHGEADSFYNQSSVTEDFGRMSVNDNSGGYGRINQGYSAAAGSYSTKKRDDDDDDSSKKYKKHSGYAAQKRDDNDDDDDDSSKKHKKKHDEFSSSKRDGDDYSSKKHHEGYGHNDTSSYGGSSGYGTAGAGYGGQSTGGFGYRGGEIAGGYGGGSDDARRQEGGKHHRSDSKEKKHKDKHHDSSDNSDDEDKKKDKHKYGRESSKERRGEWREERREHREERRDHREERREEHGRHHRRNDSD